MNPKDPRITLTYQTFREANALLQSHLSSGVQLDEAVALIYQEGLRAGHAQAWPREMRYRRRLQELEKRGQAEHTAAPDKAADDTAGACDPAQDAQDKALFIEEEPDKAACQEAEEHA